MDLNVITVPSSSPRVSPQHTPRGRSRPGSRSSRDGLRRDDGVLPTVRGASPPSRPSSSRARAGDGGTTPLGFASSSVSRPGSSSSASRELLHVAGLTLEGSTRFDAEGSDVVVWPDMLGAGGLMPAGVSRPIAAFESGGEALTFDMPALSFDFPAAGSDNGVDPLDSDDSDSATDSDDEVEEEEEEDEEAAAAAEAVESAAAKMTPKDSLGEEKSPRARVRRFSAPKRRSPRSANGVPVRHGVPVRPPFGTLSTYAKKNNIEGVRMLLENNLADVNERDASGATPLIHCVWDNHDEVVHLLLEHGADVNIATLRGFTPLHFTFERGHANLIELFFVQYGGDHMLKNSLGKTAMEGAFTAEENTRPLPPVAVVSTPSSPVRQQLLPGLSRGQEKLSELNSGTTGAPAKRPAYRPKLDFEIDANVLATMSMTEVFAYARWQYHHGQEEKDAMLAAERERCRVMQLTVECGGSHADIAIRQRRKMLAMMPWCEWMDRQGRPYFYHRKTKELTWNAPPGFVTNEMREKIKIERNKLVDDEFDGQPWQAEIRDPSRWLASGTTIVSTSSEEPDPIETFVIAMAHHMIWSICRAQAVDVVGEDTYDRAEAAALEAQKVRVMHSALKTIIMHSAAKMSLGLSYALSVAVEEAKKDAKKRNALAGGLPELAFAPEDCTKTPALRRLARLVPTRAELAMDMSSQITWEDRMHKIPPGVDGLGGLASLIQELLITLSATQLNGDSIEVADVLAHEFAEAMMSTRFMTDASKALLGDMRPESTLEQRKVAEALGALEVNRAALKDLVRAKKKQEKLVRDSLGQPPLRAESPPPKPKRPRDDRKTPNRNLALPPRSLPPLKPAPPELLANIARRRRRSTGGGGFTIDAPQLF